MLAQWESMDGRATETTLLTNVQTRGKLEPSWTPDLIAGMIQRAGKRAPRMTSQSVLRLMGQETWLTTLCQRPNHSFPIQPCGRHPRVRNPPILQKSNRIHQNPGGASLLWLPFGHFAFTNTLSMDRLSPRAAQTRAPLGPISITIWGTDTRPAIVIYWQGRLSESWLRAFEPAVPIWGPHHRPRHQTLRGSGYPQRRPLFPVVCLSLERPHPRDGGGGPNCRTWSILRWFPKPGFPKPVRGRQEPPIAGGSQSWGLWGQRHRQWQPALVKTAAPKSHFQNEIQSPGTPLVLPGTPRGSQAVLDQSQRQSTLHHMADSSRSGMVQDNGPHLDTLWWVWTGTSRRQIHGLGNRPAVTPLQGLHCTHEKHERAPGMNSSDLSRYPPEMMQGLSTAIIQHIAMEGSEPPLKFRAQPTTDGEVRSLKWWIAHPPTGVQIAVSADPTVMVPLASKLPTSVEEENRVG